MEALETGDTAIVHYLMQSHRDQYATLMKDMLVTDIIELMEQKGHLELFEWRDLFPVISKLIQAIPYYNNMGLLRQHRNIDINIRDENENTLLANAIRVRNLKMVRYLIEHGANISSVNNRGESIFGLSYQYSHQPKPYPDNHDNDKSRKIYYAIKRIIEQSG